MTAQPGRSRRLTRDGIDVLRAAVERIVPTDTDPGAREAGTIDYVVARATRSDDVVALYLAGIGELDRRAGRLRAGTRFTHLVPAEQDDVLRSLERDAHPFLRRLVVDTMEGFYGDPRHGGNRDAVSWRMLGFPGPTGGVGYRPPLGWYDAHVPGRPDGAADRP